MLIRKDKDKLEELIAEFKKELQLSDDDMRRVENNVDAEKTKVLNSTRALKKIIQEHEDAMIAGLNDFLQDYKADIDKEKQEINASIENATEIKHQCETTEHNDLKHFILESQASLHNVCETTLQTKSILSMKSAKRSSSVHYIPNPEVLTQMQMIHQGKIVESVTELKPERFFDLPRFKNPISLDISDRGEIAAVNDDLGNHCRVVLFGSDGQYLREFGGEGAGNGRLYDPYGVVFNEDRILVTDNEGGCGCIKEYGIDGSFKRLDK